VLAGAPVVLQGEVQGLPFLTDGKTSVQTHLAW